MTRYTIRTRSADGGWREWSAQTIREELEFEFEQFCDLLDSEAPNALQNAVRRAHYIEVLAQGFQILCADNVTSQEIAEAALRLLLDTTDDEEVEVYRDGILIDL